MPNLRVSFTRLAAGAALVITGSLFTAPAHHTTSATGDYPTIAKAVTTSPGHSPIASRLY